MVIDDFYQLYPSKMLKYDAVITDIPLVFKECWFVNEDTLFSLFRYSVSYLASLSVNTWAHEGVIENGETISQQCLCSTTANFQVNNLTIVHLLEMFIYFV